MGHFRPFRVRLCWLGFNALLLTSPPAFMPQDVPLGGRVPLQRTGVELKSPEVTPRELIGYRDGQPVYYDPKPEIDALGGGKYGLRWIGAQGQQLTVIYQRPDMIDVIVEASASRDSRGECEYRYTIRNLRSSKEALSGLTIQTFSPRAEGEQQAGVGVADMTRTAKAFREGRWIFFGFLEGYRAIDPGDKVSLSIHSPDPPGLVQCRAYGGSLGMKGVGEEMPTALEAAIPGYEIWPRGTTIGPDSRLSGLSQRDRLDYLTRNLPKMLHLGWIRDEPAMRWYQDRLKSGGLAAVEARARRDIQSQAITREVFDLLTW